LGITEGRDKMNRKAISTVILILVLVSGLGACDSGGGSGGINVAGMWQMQLISTGCDPSDLCGSGSPQYRWDQDRNIVVARNIETGFTLSGTIAGGNFTLERVEGLVVAHWEGAVSGDTMSGTWSITSGPFWSRGTLSGTRISNASGYVAPIGSVSKDSGWEEGNVLEMMLGE